jgi:signal transduction histidine kinase
LGITQAECSEFGWGNALHPDDAKNTIAAWQECVALRNKVWDRVHRFKDKHGRWQYVLARGVPVYDDAGNVLCWAGINLDISRLKLVEAELRQLNVTLENRVAEKTAALEARLDEKKKLLQELQDQHHFKDNFMSSLAHELRGPLSVINNVVEFLKMKDRDDNKDDYRMIKNAVLVMSKLISDIYDMGVLGKGNITLEKIPLNLTELVNQSVQAVHQEVIHRNHLIEVNVPATPVTVTADPVRLQQVVTNLLTNAVKYTNNGGVISVTVRQPTPTHVTITVSDNGIGISDEMKSKIFDVFVQENRKKEMGMGIGLSLVKGLVELHGGTIQLDTRLGKGSTFTVTLPS